MAHLFGRSWTRRELLRQVGSVEQIAGMELVESADGPARGVRQVHVRTGGGLAFAVLADRGMDIGWCTFDDAPVAWVSHVGLMHPAYGEVGGTGWLRTFPGGLVTTCGLDQFGAPSSDAGEELGQHGRASLLPARGLSLRAAWEGDEYVMEVSGELRQARMFGEHLTLRRQIAARLGGSTIELRDTVTNEGWEPAPHMLLYHCNIGFPLLDAGARLLLDAESTEPRDDDARAGAGAWDTFGPPQAGFREQVFRHVPRADAAGEAAVRLRNERLGAELEIRYPRAALPQLYQWKMLGEGAYVLGIEPANCAGIEGRAAARARGDLPVLAPGESRSYALTIALRRLPAAGGQG